MEQNDIDRFGKMIAEGAKAGHSDKTQSEAPTPRVDDLICNSKEHDPLGSLLEALTFARQLERELDGLAAMYRAACRMAEDATPVSATGHSAEDIALAQKWLTPGGNMSWEEVMRTCDTLAKAVVRGYVPSGIQADPCAVPCRECRPGACIKNNPAYNKGSAGA